MMVFPSHIRPHALTYTFPVPPSVSLSQVGRVINDISRKVKELEAVVFTPEEVVDKYGGQLALPIPIRSAAVDVVKKARQVKGLEGLHPQTLAGAALLLLCSVQRDTGDPLNAAFVNGGGGSVTTNGGNNIIKEFPSRSIDSIAKATLVSAQTIRKTHALLYEHRQLVVSESFYASLKSGQYDFIPTKEL